MHQSIEEQGKEILMPMVIAKLHFIEVERKFSRRDAVMFQELPLGLAPEPLEAVDVDPASTKACPVIDGQMAIATKRHGIVSAEFVGVDQRAAPSTTGFAGTTTADRTRRWAISVHVSIELGSSRRPGEPRIRHHGETFDAASGP